MKRKLKFLHPQKNLVQGIAAINAGADAVYIERHCLSTNERNNSVEDIAELVKYAHLFNIRFCRYQYHFVR
jgi:putative protease